MIGVTGSPQVVLLSAHGADREFLAHQIGLSALVQIARETFQRMHGVTSQVGHNACPVALGSRPRAKGLELGFLHLVRQDRAEGKGAHDEGPACEKEADPERLWRDCSGIG